MLKEIPVNIGAKQQSNEPSDEQGFFRSWVSCVPCVQNITAIGFYNRPNVSLQSEGGKRQFESEYKKWVGR